MSDLQQLWRMSWVGELGRHLATVLAPLLPSDVELVVTAHELHMMSRRHGAPLTVAWGYALPVPNEHAILGAPLVDRVFSEVQDEIALGLGRAWPLAESGAALTATATEIRDGVALSFVSRTTDDELHLEPFRPPPALAETPAAG